jgi:hypothetical protein
MWRMVCRWLQPNKTQQIPVPLPPALHWAVGRPHRGDVCYQCSVYRRVYPETWHTRVAPERELDESLQVDGESPYLRLSLTKYF